MIGVFCVKRTSLPSLPLLRTLALSSVFGGRGVCGTVHTEMRDGVEHKSSDLPRGEECLVLWKLFSPTHGCRQVAGWRKAALTSGRLTVPSSI